MTSNIVIINGIKDEIHCNHLNIIGSELPLNHRRPRMASNIAIINVTDDELHRNHLNITG